MNTIARPRRVTQVAAITLGLVSLGVGLATVPLDTLTHTPGTGGPVADALSPTRCP